MTAVADAGAKGTKGFIDENPATVQFIRTPRVSTTAGGKVDGVPTPLAPQTVRLVAQTGYMADRRISAQGDAIVPRFVVVGMPDVDMKRGDKFQHDGEWFLIASVNSTPPYAKRGEAIEHGAS